LTILRALTTAVAGACVLSTAGLVDLRQDAREHRADAAERTPAVTVATDTGPRAESVASEVADLDPLVAVAGATRCLAAGSSCAPDDLLDVDTTRLRAEAVADTLRADAGRAARGQSATALASAEDLTAALQGWLDVGCGGSIDGVAVTGPVPDACDAQGSEARTSLERWVTTIRRWTPEGGH
jgi:hypothetical protein